MRTIRRERRGLAEIVGTLMLVVIVVAAATAFSFFVAAYQKQVQSEEALNHDKSLEDLRILDLTPNLTGPHSPYLSDLLVEVASLDVNPMTINGVIIDGNPVLKYTVSTSSGAPLGPPGCFNGGAFSTNTSCSLSLPAEAQVFLLFNLTFGALTYAFGSTNVSLKVSSLLEFDLFSSYGNEFVQSFVPPVAIAQMSFVNVGNSSTPLLDGMGSYQPPDGTDKNVTIDLWSWSVSAIPPTVCGGSPDCGPFSGEEVQLSEAFPSGTWSISLTVTDSDSLIGTTTVDYTA